MQATVKKSLLFVDDEQRILRTLKALFRRDYDVYVANSGDEAIKLLNQKKVDVVVSDQRMPKMLGHELLSEVRHMQPQAIRMLLTGYMDKSAIINTINDGEIYRFISKPWNIDEIKQLIAEAALASESDFIDDIATPAQSQATPKERLAVLADNVPAILMMEPNQNVRNQIRAVAKDGGFNAYVAGSIQEAVETLNLRKNIGTAILSVDHNTEEVIAAVAMMRKVQPELSTVVLTDMTDSQTAVDLINRGQVFRYLPKPLEGKRLENALVDGMLRHNKLKNNVSAAKRYRADTTKLRISSALKKMFSIFDSSDSKPG